MDKELVEIKKLLSSLIISSPRGLTSKRLLIDYRNEIGKDIPFKKYGFYTFDTFLHSLSDTCRVHGSGPNALIEPVINEKVKHINEMIIRQRPPKMPKRGYGARRPTGVLTGPSGVVKPSADIKLPPLIPTHNVVGLPPPEYYLDQRAKTNNSNQNKNRTSYEYYTAVPTKPQNLLEMNLKPPEPPQALFEMNPKPPDPPQALLLMNLKPPKPLKAEENKPETLPEKYTPDPNFIYEKDESGSYTSELNFSDMSDESIYNSDEEGPIVRKSSASQNESAGAAAASQPPCIGSRITTDIRNNLAALIAEHKDGIWCSKLNDYYSRRFGVTLDPFDYGFSSMSQMCDALTDIFYVIRPGKGDWKLYNRKEPKPNEADIEEWVDYIKKFYRPPQNTETVAPFPEDILTNKESAPIVYPPDVVQLGAEIETQEMPSNTKINDYVYMIISEVYDPSKYWFQLRSEANKLNILMDELQVFYHTNYNLYKMDKSQVQEGLYCVAIILGEYHRGIISQVYGDEQLKIFFIDYGTVAEINIKKVCFLHEQFSYLPRQAIRGRLSNIKPIEQNTMWPREASRRFLKLIRDKKLVGYLTHFDYDNYTFGFIVTDVTDDNIDIHINDALLDEGFAVPGNKAEKCPTSRAIVPNIHLYPTFDEIEGGLCPTVADLDKFEWLRFELADIFTDYFLPRQTPFYVEHLSSTEVDTINEPFSNLTLEDSIAPTNVTTNQGCDNNNENGGIESNQGIRVPPGLVPQVETPPPISVLKFESFVDSFNCLKLYVMSQTQNYSTDICQILYRHLMDCDNILKNLTITFDSTERQLLTNSYLEKVNSIKNIMLAHRLQQSLLPILQSTNQVTNLPSSNEPIFKDNQSSEDVIVTDIDKISVPNSGVIVNKNESFCSDLKEKLNVKDKYIFVIVTDNFKIHLLKIENEYYIISQELITTLLESKDQYCNWIKTCGISFPSLVLNLKEYPEVYDQIKTYNIPGIEEATNVGYNANVGWYFGYNNLARNDFGCYVRLTLLKNVPRIIQLLGRKEIYDDVNFIIQFLSTN